MLTVRTHPELRREGQTIHSDVRVSCTAAMLGTTVTLTTVDGPVDLKVPPGTQPGSTLVLGKRGVPKLGKESVRGDHLVHVHVSIPRTLTPDEKELVQQLAEKLKESGDNGATEGNKKSAKAGWFS